MRRDAAGIHDEQKDVDTFDCGSNFVHHLAAERGIGRVQARSIDEHDLAALLRHDALNAIARGLRFRCNDGDLLSDQVIQQRGFSRVGAADNGHKAGAEAGFLRLD